MAHVYITIHIYRGIPRGATRDDYAAGFTTWKRSLRIIIMEVIDTRELEGNDHCSDDVRRERRYTGLYIHNTYIYILYYVLYRQREMSVLIVGNNNMNPCIYIYT